MNVSIKILKPYNHPLNGEESTLSLLVKSSLATEQHFQGMRRKFELLLRELSNMYPKCKIVFYHKISLANKFDVWEFQYSKTCIVDTKKLKRVIDDSMRDEIELLRHPKILSHFINLKIEEDEIIRLDEKRFEKIKRHIGNKLSRIDLDSLFFVDKEDPFSEELENIKRLEDSIICKLKETNKKYLEVYGRYLDFQMFGY